VPKDTTRADSSPSERKRREVGGEPAWLAHPCDRIAHAAVAAGGGEVGIRSRPEDGGAAVRHPLNLFQRPRGRLSRAHLSTATM
jgi:hypothetical protein